MKEYEVEVTETKIVYVYADSEDEAKVLAQIEALQEVPNDVTCDILSFVDLGDMGLNICGECGCDGCLFQHIDDTTMCKREAERRNKTDTIASSESELYKK